ncbi:MAG: hypothetical protein E4H33_03920, partial [Anaerolineales bacterium]
MKKILVLYLSILIFLAACVQGGPAPLESGDLIKTGMTETMEVQDDPAPAPSQEVEGETHSCFPVHPGRQALPLPVGFMTGIKPTAIRFYDSTGFILGDKQTPNLYSLYGNRLHPAGGITNGISGVPLIYHVRESEDFVKANIGANIFQMDKAPEIVVITGAEGKFSLVVYSSAEYTDDGLITTLK